MIYALRGGGVVKAETRHELVEFLNEQSPFGFHQSLHEYMAGVSLLCKSESDADIRIDSTENFVDDLKEMGFVIEMNEGDIIPDYDKFTE